MSQNHAVSEISYTWILFHRN